MSGTSVAQYANVRERTVPSPQGILAVELSIPRDSFASGRGPAESPRHLAPAVKRVDPMNARQPLEGSMLNARRESTASSVTSSIDGTEAPIPSSEQRLPPGMGVTSANGYARPTPWKEQRRSGVPRIAMSKIATAT